MNTLAKTSRTVAALTNQHAQTLTATRSLATHWNPQFKKQRKAKFVKMKLPDFEKIAKTDMAGETLEERRSKFIKEGIEPPTSFEYKPFNITTSSEIFDPYVAPEGDGRASLFTTEGLKQSFSGLTKKVGKSFKHLRTVKKHDETFDEALFGEYAQHIYCDAHKALMNRDTEKLLEYATEHAYGKMWMNMKFKTVRWKWLESLEEPVVKHIVTREMLNASTLYAQVTVRLHSKQLLAVYDRFGRLAYGSETIPKDVIEYVVFEKHLTNVYGTWRMHDKIVPDWAPPQTPVLRSYRQPKLFKVDETAPETNISKFKKDDSHLERDETQPKVALN